MQNTTSSSSQWDAIVIGTGQAGPSLAKRLADAGQRVAIVERKRFGGTCVNTGCIPTKTLIASARAAHIVRRAADFGVTVDQSQVGVNMQHVRQRKDQVAGASEKGVEKMLRELSSCRVLTGHARFESAHHVRVGNELLEAPQIFINVGARAAIPEIPGLSNVPYLTNSQMVDLDTLPSHLVVLGGGYVGLEFAQMYRRFGSKVTIIERGRRLLSKEDDDVAEVVHNVLKSEQIEILTGTTPTNIEKNGEGVTVSWNSGEASGSHLLVALGRRPNTDDLGLDQAGIVVDNRGYIQVDSYLATNVAGIWALGDCNGRGAFTHTSYNDYQIVAANLLEGLSRRVEDRIPAYNIYTDPPLARIGLSGNEVRKSGRPALIAKRPMTKVARAVEKGETEGFLKILICAETRRILGAALIGIECDEVIHSLLDIMYSGTTSDVILNAVHIHPTISELLPTTLESLEPLK